MLQTLAKAFLRKSKKSVIVTWVSHSASGFPIVCVGRGRGFPFSKLFVNLPQFRGVSFEKYLHLW
jgi:hypothetical protein